ncbi:unnamed protein product [Rotaria sp. Silwood2]|nr:unnamed protein product [Rotaria sp. Silwood2]
MPKKESENSLFSSRDLEHNNLPKHETNPQETHDINAQIPYPDDSWVDQPPAHWHSSMQHMNHDQYPPPMVHHQPYDHQTIHPTHPQHPPMAHHQPYDHQTIHSTHPQHPPMAHHQPYDHQTIHPTHPQHPPMTHHHSYNHQIHHPAYPQYPPMTRHQPYNHQIIHPGQPQYPPNPVIQPTQVSKMYHYQNSSSLPPAPLGRTPSEPVAAPLAPGLFNHSSVPISPGHIQHLPPGVPPQYGQPPSPLPRHHSRRPLSPYYDDIPHLPPIRRRHRPREYDDYGRYRHSEPFHKSYLGQRYNDHRHRKQMRWYD